MYVAASLAAAVLAPAGVAILAGNQPAQAGTDEPVPQVLFFDGTTSPAGISAADLARLERQKTADFKQFLIVGHLPNGDRVLPGGVTVDDLRARGARPENIPD